MIEEKIKRNVFEVAGMHESDHKAYWRDRSYVELMGTIESYQGVSDGSNSPKDPQTM
ncbi:MAG: hypothetical protein JW902_16035 [Syntrophaceae bacterium]|nr:hypothetical protein [Syntrophaceae bacterium]